MSEDGDMWREIRQARQDKRWNNVKQSLGNLDRAGIAYECLSHSVQHYRIGDFDFWPTTGKFIHRPTKKDGRGVRRLISLITNRENSSMERNQFTRQFIEDGEKAGFTMAQLDFLADYFTPPQELADLL